MYLSILKSTEHLMAVTADSRLIKADALNQLIATADLYAAFKAEAEQARIDQRRAHEMALAEGYQTGLAQAGQELAQRTAAAHFFMNAAHTHFKTAFSTSVADAVARVLKVLPEVTLLEATLQHTYATLGDELSFSLAVNPDQLHLAEQACERIGIPKPLSICTDDSLEQHSCRLESRFTVVEHSLNAIIDGIQEAAFASFREADSSNTDQ